MKAFLRSLAGAALLLLSFEALAQPCNSSPTIVGASGTHTNIATTTATLGGNVTDDGGPNCTLEIGVRWSTTSGGEDNEVTESFDAEEGVFTVNVTGLPAGTLIYYIAYASNGDGEVVTNEKSFYTLASEPTTNAASLTATTISNTQIELTFPAAGGITNADGYIVLMNEGAVPSAGDLNDGAAPTGAGHYLHTLNSTVLTSYIADVGDPNTTYYFAIIPYNQTGGENATYNYYTSGFPTANATSAADVAITALTAANGVHSFVNPLNSGTTNVAIIGFSLNASGSVDFQSVVLHLPTSVTTNKLSNFRLCRSTDNDFDGIGTDLPIGGITPVVTDDDITITLTTPEVLSGSPTISYFLVADVDATVNSATASVEFSWDEGDFVFDPAYIDGTESQSRTYGFEDIIPPVLQSTLPADDATAVDVGTDKLVLTFNENVNNLTGAAGNDEERVILYKAGSPDVAVATIARASVSANGSSPVVEVDITGELEPHSNYYVLFGDDVLVDKPDDNPWGGISDPAVWNFSTSGIVFNQPTANICGGSFEAIPNIVISETGIGDFNDGLSQTLTLSLANTSEFIFSNSGVTVSSLSADLTNLAISVGLTTLTITYDVVDGTVLDNITISGLKVYATGVAASTTIIRTGGTANWDGDNGTAGSSPVYSTINVGANPPAQPQLAAAQDLIHCAGEDISAKTLSLEAQGVTFNWYSDASLSTLETSIADPDVDVNIVTDLGMTSPAVAGTYTFYVVAVDDCQSAPPVEIEIQVSANPVANAGQDRTGVDAVCADAVLTLGGNPTLQTPSGPGSYTYSWEYIEGTPEPAALANPGYTMANATNGLVEYNFAVAITDVNSCVGKDTVTIEVKAPVQVTLTSPNSNVFTPTSPNQTLTASPPGGVFSGVGIVQSEATTYEFSPSIAHATDPATLPKNFQIFYTVTSDGCTVTNAPVATFTISNSFFTSVQSEYCNNEYPNPSTGQLLQVDANGLTIVNNKQNSWNISERFSRGPSAPLWFSGLFQFYAYNSYVRYNNEFYRCDNPLSCSGAAGAPDVNGNWVLENILKVQFDGMIRNYYDGYYGGVSPSFTVVRVGGVYRMGTNINYNLCPTCNASYPAAYLEFERPQDIKYLLPAWSSARTYGPGNVVVYNDQIYRCLSTTFNTQPNLNGAVWQNVTTGNFDTGEHFQVNDGGLRSGFYVAGQGVRINRIPVVSINGLANGQRVCTFEMLDLDNDPASSTGNLYTLTGNSPTPPQSQEFSVRLDGLTEFDGGGGAIVNDILTPGKATFDTKTAFLNSLGASLTSKNIQIRYEVDPGTIGSTGDPCYGSTVITVQVLKNSSFEFDSDVVDPAGSVYCYTEPSKNLQAKVGASVISGSSGSPNSVVFTGYGVSDLANSSGTFTPSLGIEQLSPGTTAQTTIPITATYRDVDQCLSKRVRSFDINPDISPAFTFGGRSNYCYEDLSNAFTGHTQQFTNGASSPISVGRYEVFYKDPGGTSHLLETIFSNNTNFLAKEYYDDVQTVLTTEGFVSDLNQTVSLNVVYIESLNADKLCSESHLETMVINPPRVLDIFGLTNGDILCRNDNLNLSQGNVVTFEGSVTGSGIFNMDDDNDFSSVNPTLNSTVNNSGGTASIDLLSAYNAASGSSDPKPVFLQYLYTAPGCTGPANVIKNFNISPPPAIGFDFTAGNTPTNAEPFCFEDAPVQLKTNQNSNVTITGDGVSDSGLGNGLATFTPELGFNTSVSKGGSLNAPQNILVTASILDGFGCVNKATVQYVVNPIPQAGLNLNTAELNYCYEDTDQLIQGNQAKSWFRIEYLGVTNPYTDFIGDINNPEPQVTFEPDTRFDEAKTLGASTLSPASFNLYYSVADNDNCTNTLGPYTLTVANQIDVSIAGLTDNDIFCSNENKGVQKLVFNPFPEDASKRTFTINGQSTTLSGPTFDFMPALAGNDYTLQYVVISGNNCTNTETTDVKILPSPRSVFSVPPACDGALIDFNADGTNNLASATYTWTLSDSVRTGQFIQHRFPASNIYGVQLKVEYPAYNNDPALVCQDSLRLDQTVGAVPKDLGFKFFNVCEEDETTFEVQSDIPISKISWDFGDQVSTGFGFSAAQIENVDNTSGSFQAPGHKYAGAGNYDVIVTGKTSDIYGGCEYAELHDIAILKNWVPLNGEMIYDMASLDGGRGFWVTEDAKGNATWDFAIANKEHRIKTDEMVWVTDPTDPYKADDASFVNSPCFDLSGFDRPVLSIKHWTDTEASDGAVLQYSVDGGDTWSRLGNVASGLDWYNQITITSNPGNQDNLSSGWSLLNQQDWATGKHTLDVLPAPRTKVRLRVAFSSFTNPNGRDGFAFNNVVIEERNRTILVENFSNLEQGGNNDAFKAFRADGNGIFNPNELVKLQYHHASAQNASNADELNQDNPRDNNARAAFYGVMNPVRAFVDGGFGQSSDNATFTSATELDTYFSLRSLVTSPVDISIDFEPVPSDRLNVKATIQATSELGGPGQYNVFIAIAEQEVLDQVYVLRKFLPNAAGTPLTSLSATAPAQEIMTTYDMRHVTRLENGDFAPFAVIVFVQHIETKDVLQTVMRQDGTASTDIVTGVETSFDNYIRLYPNPADAALNIILPAPVKADTPLIVFDTFGKQVYNGQFRTGEHVKSIDTKSFSGGVYLIQLSTPEGQIRKKAMVVHE